MLLEAKRAGEALIAAKKLCPRGTFDTWLTQNTRVKRAMAYRYMKVADRFTQLPSSALDELAGVGTDAFLGYGKAQEPAPAAPAPAPSFTREDAEYALKIHARVERGQDGERDVAATKLAKVAEGFAPNSPILREANHDKEPPA